MKGLWDSGSRGLKLPEIFSSTGDHMEKSNDAEREREHMRGGG